MNSFRRLRFNSGIDFCSNDYLGIVKNNLLTVSSNAQEKKHGSTGSRLISGNYELIEETEQLIADFHRSESALLFNSGYDANLGLLACVAQREDTILYDQLSHASIRDGIRLSVARSYSFLHNDIDDLQKKLSTASGRKFVVTESVFSMDGDVAPIAAIAALCDTHDAMMIVDEAHATGIIGDKGEGLVQHLGLQDKCFARIHTFGKALGCHGSAILGSGILRDYLINFSRPFIYTTGMPAGAVQAIRAAYALVPTMIEERKRLHSLTLFFRDNVGRLQLTDSITPIQAIIIPGNNEVRKVAAALQDNGLDVRPILYPTVPVGSERLRVVLHAFNSENEIDQLISGIGQ